MSAVRGGRASYRRVSRPLRTGAASEIDKAGGQIAGVVTDDSDTTVSLEDLLVIPEIYNDKSAIDRHPLGVHEHPEASASSVNRPKTKLFAGITSKSPSSISWSVLQATVAEALDPCQLAGVP